MNREFWEAQRDLVTDTSELFGEKTESINNDFSFKSIAEFKKYIKNSNKVELLGNRNEIEYTAEFRYNLIFVGGIIIYVKQQIKPTYSIIDVSSSEWGVTISFSWEQTNYDKSTNGNYTTITVSGKLNYNLFIDGIGTIYSDICKFQVVVDNRTDHSISMKKLN